MSGFVGCGSPRLQSRLFNQVVAERLDSIDRLMDGDLAYKHDNGAVFPLFQPRPSSRAATPLRSAPPVRWSDTA